MGDERAADQRHGRAVIGYAGLVGAVLYVWTTLREYPVGSMSRPGAAVLPLLIGAGLAIASVLVILESHRKAGQATPLDLEWRHVRRALAVLGILIGYLAVIPIMGFVVATTGFMLVTLRLLTTTSWVRIGVAAVLTAVAFYGLFAVLLAVPLPIGVFNIG